jgi:hypothetical protein
MQIKVRFHYPHLTIGEITCHFDVHEKRSKYGDTVVAEFISATHADESGRDLPVTQSELKKLDVYDFFRDDAVEEFYEFLRSHEADADYSGDSADNNRDG